MIDNTFGINIIPENDNQRVEALRSYNIINGMPDIVFEDIVVLASKIFNVPIAIISLVDSDSVYAKAGVGMGNVRTAARGTSLCSITVMYPGVTVFENTLTDPCLLVNPWVAGEFGLKFYAGAPLNTAEGLRIGTICLLDKQTRDFTEKDKTMLSHLAAIVMNLIELNCNKLATV
jgi:GAF domain-containing protein